MNPEIQDTKPQIFNFSRSDIREQNLKPLLQNLFAQLRDDFLHDSSIKKSLSQFSAEWLRVIEKYYSPVGASPGFPRGNTDCQYGTGFFSLSLVPHTKY